MKNTGTEHDGWRWTLDCPSEQAFFIHDALSELVAPLPTAVAIFEQSPGSHCVQAYYLTKPALEDVNDALVSMGVAQNLLQEAHISPVEKINWVARSQIIHSPIKIGRFVIHGNHDRGRGICSSQNAIEIDAAEAFGTARHGTTRSCLRALEMLCGLTQPRKILDLGTGSGILAIAAAKISRDAGVCATDNDPIACRTASSNRDLNRVKSQIEVVEAEGFDHPRIRCRRPFDLVIANILATPLKALAPDFQHHLMPGGHIILSGILTVQAASVCATYRAHGFAKNTEIRDGEWSTIIMQKMP